MTRALTLMLIVIATPGTDAQPPPRPTFDCAKATGDVETLICKDPGLIALDRKLADVFAAAIKKLPTKVVAEQRRLQRAWIDGRNECVEADDVRACTERTYQMRIVELQILSGQVKGATPVDFVCTGGEDRPLRATFFETEPRSALIAYGGDRVIAFIARSASGARYTAANVDFWDRQGEATLTWFGSGVSCKPAL
jgi:uncharacterized protein